MQIVINIPDFVYNGIRNMTEGKGIIEYNAKALYNAIYYATPLPKHHGRLIDENKVIDEIVCEEIDGRYYDVIYAHSVYDAETIIEADEEEEK